ncbi:GNAT family N-acetyltransferase [Janthinobacterium lividum]|uniref:N-acetyltransferase n=1 Tax=Janthinobacterium lividum TaxID=29581 RepID=A0ABU0Y270_9BURK|nr:GNAT family N-acetyltransferase [Janthinobacterium lividum]MDQ4628691.1 N-acetyltransferase [Janthinobacterium lividum]MDQ4677113.1 N-acetyltransferase [Janthinobacterium lividum]MDQ4687650.1 N-acetyltransferase [Janthinobacterium lividum]
MAFTFHPLSDIANEEWLVLLNHPDVIRHMPLATESWDEHAVMEWAKGKDAQWQANGYGPWAIRIDGAFAGWGGFQKEGREADLALVLLPAFWGHGPALVRRFMHRRLELGIGPVSILLPPSRTRVRGLARIGFALDCEVEYEGRCFLKFRAIA